VTLVYLFAALGALFVVLAAVRIVRDRGKLGPQWKTWLIIGVLFVAVSAWLSMRGAG